MEFSGEKSEALRLLQGIVSGRLEASDAYNIAIKLDPMLFYFVIKYLREAHAGDTNAMEPINQRLSNLLGPHQDLVKRVKAGDSDVMREWFDDCHSCREFKNDEEGYIDLVYEKLES